MKAYIKNGSKQCLCDKEKNSNISSGYRFLRILCDSDNLLSVM